MSLELRALAFKLMLAMEVAERSAPFHSGGHGKGGRQFHCVSCGRPGGILERHSPTCPVGIVQHQISPFLVPWEDRTPDEKALAEASEATFSAWCTSELARLEADGVAQ